MVSRAVGLTASNVNGERVGLTAEGQRRAHGLAGVKRPAAPRASPGADALLLTPAAPCASVPVRGWRPAFAREVAGGFRLVWWAPAGSGSVLVVLAAGCGRRVRSTMQVVVSIAFALFELARWWGCVD